MMKVEFDFFLVKFLFLWNLSNYYLTVALGRVREQSI